jgi:hypothetical protein
MYLAFLQSTLGQSLLFGMSVLTAGGIVLWARGHAERSLIASTAVIMTLLFGVFYAVALRAGWWAGAFFAMPANVQAGVVIPISLVGWTLWLAGYRWLTERSRQALQVYLAVSLLLVLAVAVAHRLNLGQGKILVGPEWAVLFEALALGLVAWVPVLVYEWLRRTLEGGELVP